MVISGKCSSTSGPPLAGTTGEMKEPSVDKSGGIPVDEKSTHSEPGDVPKKQKQEYRFREVQLGIWTLYYPITNSWREYLPAFDWVWVIYDMAKSLPIVWKFILETLSLGPIFFAVYFLSSTLSSFLPALQLYNNSTLLTLIESAATGKHVAREQFDRIGYTYVLTFASGFILRKLERYSRPILEQRVSSHFKQRLLQVQSRFDLTTSENPDVQSKITRASSWFASAWNILGSILGLISIGADIVGHMSVISRVVGSREDGKLFMLLCVSRPLALFLLNESNNEKYYAMITDTRRLRMDALYTLGTSETYKKEVIADNLEGHINSQYDKDKRSLGDTPQQEPSDQLSSRNLISYGDVDTLCDALPLLAFAWNSLQNPGRNDLSSLVLMQQAASSLQNTLFSVIYSGTSMANLFKNTLGLYDVLELKPTMVDGDVLYPEETFKDEKGMSIEFKSVNFKYPMTDKMVLEDMSFSINPGQLCVIVGENGCGKSTTINLITRMYDCTSGNVLIDGRPLGEFALSSYRAATSVMYQDYNHLPLTIHENILLGRPDCENPDKAVEEAARLGGAYDFVQKLPLKFGTNLLPSHTGFSTDYFGEDEDDETKYQKFIEAQKPTKLSGGEWQRLALSKTFLKNSGKVRLLCYDEPSASLDPNAEYEIFERLRQLRGDKTMIFVTHRFGHLTKHADLILYVKGGSIIEKGTHKQLLDLDGEYAKMYKIQSQAFED